MKSKSAIYKDT